MPPPARGLCRKVIANVDRGVKEEPGVTKPG